ncbi:MAG: signal peptidase I [Syntrophales bacterium]|jgi:signal peptidase I|nr:signal peptidase I [Syntrophales bacterium]MCK9527138.1 signal peptidase I [Syntrophales bacterium]MDX9921737.1 signal peptidase I [Syntrophales bacterium]
MGNDTGKNKKSIFREYAKTFIIAILIALFVRTFVVQAFKIPSGSMKDTLLVGDHVLVSKFSYGVKLPLIRKTLIPFGTPKQGDIAVFIYPEDRSKDFIKRVIAVEGDLVEIRNKEIFVNGKPYRDNHGVYRDEIVYPRSVQPRDNFGPVRVPEGHVFTMGDNRDESYDSRFWGFVGLDDLHGKAFLIYWSWNGEESSVRWNRIGTILK